jgi:hypothetical protein
MSAGSSCKNCKRVREHVASLLTFRVLESTVGARLRIAGVAMAAGISRNFNIYTPEELKVFAEKLVGAPLYMEHVTANAAVGKCTKANYDSVSKQVLYEAEIYDPAIAEKIRDGLIQHVSVGADYSAIDVVDAKVPHGLYDPEISFVAVPGVPETTVHVLETLKQGQVNSNGVEKLEEKDLENLSGKVAAKVSKTSVLEVEKMKTEFSLAEAKLKTEVAEAQKKAAEAEGKIKLDEAARDEANGKLAIANKAVEAFKTAVPVVDLLASPPVLMSVSEHIAVLERLMPPAMVERSSMGMQRQGQAVRAALLKAQERLKVK